MLYLSWLNVLILCYAFDLMYLFWMVGWIYVFYVLVYLCMIYVICQFFDDIVIYVSCNEFVKRFRFYLRQRLVYLWFDRL